MNATGAGERVAGAAITDRPLGRTGVTLSPVGFGCAAGSVVLDADDETRQGTVDAALRSGIGYFDTAAAYGDGASEVRLGRTLRALSATPLIGTKVALQRDDVADPRSAVLRHVERSLDRLGVDSVTLLTLHNRPFVNPMDEDFAVGVQLSLRQVLGAGGVAEAFTELRAQGVVRACGFTTLGGDIAAYEEMVASGAFGFVNASINLTNPSAVRSVGPGFAGVDRGRAAALAAAAGMGVLAVHVLDKGRLSGTGAHVGPGAAPVDAARAIDDNLARTALRYVLSRPEVSCAVLGFAGQAHVADAARAVGLGPLSPDQIDRIERAALTAEPPQQQP